MTLALTKAAAIFINFKCLAYYTVYKLNEYA